MNTNYTHIADLYAIAKAEFDAAEARVKALRQQILATGAETVCGDAYMVSVSLSERTSLDSKAVKEILSEAQIAKCSKTALVETLRIKAALQAAA